MSEVDHYEITLTRGDWFGWTWVASEVYGRQHLAVDDPGPIPLEARGSALTKRGARRKAIRSCRKQSTSPANETFEFYPAKGQS